MAITMISTMTLLRLIKMTDNKYDNDNEKNHANNVNDYDNNNNSDN